MLVVSNIQSIIKHPYNIYSKGIDNNNTILEAVNSD